MPGVGEFEQLVLLSLLRVGKDAYGVSIWRGIVDRPRRDGAVRRVFQAPGRAGGQGFVASREGEPTAARGGRRKKHYRLLAAGHRALTQALGALRSMTDGLDERMSI